MSKKTKKHKHTIHHRRIKRRYNHAHSIHHPRKTLKKIHRKRREISIIPRTKSISTFTVLSNKPNPRGEIISVNIKQSSGNIIQGLRDYNKHM
jgi:hypothetical protein